MGRGRLAFGEGLDHRGDQLPQVALFGTHQPGGSGGDFMVVAEQVQRTMDEESRQLFSKGVSAGTSLADGRFGRDHHVT